MVRIVAGSARGLRIKTVPSERTKPTLDRVKEPMFSILAEELPGRQVLDLFAGNGTLGLEALSRGAAFACFNDQDCACAKIIQENLAYTGLSDKAEVTQLDYKKALGRYQAAGKKFGLILLDPPYAAGFLKDVLKRLEELCLCEPGAAVMCEHSREDAMPETVGIFTKEKSRAYGSVGITLYRVGEGK